MHLHTTGLIAYYSLWRLHKQLGTVHRQNNCIFFLPFTKTKKMSSACSFLYKVVNPPLILAGTKIYKVLPNTRNSIVPILTTELLVTQLSVYSYWECDKKMDGAIKPSVCDITSSPERFFVMWLDLYNRWVSKTTTGNANNFIVTKT